VDGRLRNLRDTTALGLLLAGGLVVVAHRAGRLGGEEPPPQAVASAAAPGAVPTSDLYAVLPTFTPAAAPTGASPPPQPTAPANRVGIIPGHWQFDSGAVCPDGLREVDVTTDVALRVRALLEYRGFEVDLLPEHDPTVPQPPVQGYRGAALVSIHADSCDVPGVSGFKVARGQYSTTGDADDRLVECLTDAYAEATLLPFHEDTVTRDMWNYYAFREIAAETPAAIVELGFLNGDREVLDALRYEMALGIANGLSCFLGGAP
jgi:N-acetylmuramoyl-L-alanine amidase